MKRLFTVLLAFAITSSFGQIQSTLSPADKVYGLSKFWQEVNYNFIYLDKVDRVKWDSLYRQMITTVQKTENDYQYYRELQKFCAFLKDGHTNIDPPSFKGVEYMTTMFGDYRFFIENIDGKAIIVRVNLSKKEEIPVGSEIIEVNGKSTKDYIKESVSPYISSSTDYVLEDWSTERLLSGLEGDRYLLKIKKPKGEIVTLNLTHIQTKEKEVFPEFDKNRELLEFKWYDHQVAYVGLNSFGNPKIDTLFINLLPELYKAKALIIDLRYNGGGSTEIGTAILKYLTNDKMLYGEKSTTRLHIPTYKAWGSFFTAKDTLAGKADWGMAKEEVTKSFLMARDQYYYHFDFAPDTVKLDAKRIVVPTVLLTGHNTASAAEDFLIYADNQKHMIKMGTNTFGSTGQPYSFDVPGGGSARVCTKMDTYPDGKEFVGYGIKPDIVVEQTVNDYMLKKDPAVNKALEIFEGKNQIE